MSRSRKKTPIVPRTTAESEKSDKQKANRKARKLGKIVLLKSDPEDVQEGQFRINNISNVWLFPKDGKQFLDVPESYRK